MRKHFGWFCAALVISNSFAGQAAVTSMSDINNNANSHYESEAVGLLSHYLQVDTTNPPGNEKLGAQFLASVLGKEGIQAHLFDTAPGRTCVYARLKGNGKKRAIILLNHIDVVPANAHDWKHHPFKGEIIDGEIWGRGTLDIKGFGIAQLETMLMLKRSGKVLDRDIIFLATPDEESGGEHGARVFVKNHSDLVRDAEFLLNEVGAIYTNDSGKPLYWGVDIAEKSVLWLKLTVTGEAGHASLPLPDSAPNKLVLALAKIIESPPPPHVSPVVAQSFHDIAPAMPEPMKSYLTDITASIQDPKVYAAILANKQLGAVLRNTISLTVLKSGYKTNVIPKEATAELDCRLLPATDKDQFIKEIKDTVSPFGVEVSELTWQKADASLPCSALFDAITKVAAKEQPGVPVVPIICPGFTDSHWFRDMDTICYGFAPFEVDPEHIATIHGTNERIPVRSFVQGIKFLHEIINNLAGPSDVQ
jgi:acetylornithine deacetylase/succinyl-diaminopimelate desuccinylase-like protein